MRSTIALLVFATLVNSAGADPANQIADPPGSPTPATTAKAPVHQLIAWLLDEDRQLRGIPFSEVIFDATGKAASAHFISNRKKRRIK